MSMNEYPNIFGKLKPPRTNMNIVFQAQNIRIFEYSNNYTQPWCPLTYQVASQSQKVAPHTPHSGPLAPPNIRIYSNIWVNIRIYSIFEIVMNSNMNIYLRPKIFEYSNIRIFVLISVTKSILKNNFWRFFPGFYGLTSDAICSVIWPCRNVFNTSLENLEQWAFQKCFWI